MASKKLKLDAYEQSIEESLDQGGWKPVTGKKQAELLAKVAEAHANLRKGRGGARPNAGRKFLGKVRMTINVHRETRDFLIREAGKPAGMGAVVDRLAAASTARSTR